MLDRQIVQFAQQVASQSPEQNSAKKQVGAVLPHNLMVRQWHLDADAATGAGYVSHPQQFRIPADLPTGFSTVQLKAGADTASLRVYTLRDAQTQVQVAAPLAESDMLSRELAEALVLPVSLILLFFMVVFRWRMRQALQPLQRLHEDIALRKQGWKEGLTEEDQPVELAAPVQAINQLVQQLLKNLELQQHFIADAAHELRTPLTALRLQLQNLQQTLAPEQQAEGAESLEEMGRGIARATRLVEQLLQLARVQHHSQAYQAEVIDIVPLVRSTMAELSWAASGANMEMAYEGPERVLVSAYPFALRILLENLLHNAFKYGLSGSVVQVCLFSQMPDEDQGIAKAVKLPKSGKNGKTAPVALTALQLSEATTGEAPEYYWALQVRNEGTGIAAVWYPRLFERFFRLSEHQSLPGSGLGLPIVREIARLHGSEVYVAPLHEGRELPGFCIGVRLPAVVNTRIGERE